MQTVSIIQARVGSRRLPAKVLKPLAGMPVLEHVIRRVGMAAGVSQVVVATTVLGEDDAIEQLSDSCGVITVRGSVDDVLERYNDAARLTQADHIVRITADCPCSDPGLIARLLDAHLTSGADYTSNTHPRSFPHGADVEVVTRTALQTAHEEAIEKFDREHVMPFIWSRPERFRLHNVSAAVEESAPELRVTLDTPADYIMLQALFDLLPAEFRIADVVRVANDHPWLPQINGAEIQKMDHLQTDPAKRARAEAIEVARWACRQELAGAAELLLQCVQDEDLLSRAGQVGLDQVVRQLNGLAER